MKTATTMIITAALLAGCAKGADRIKPASVPANAYAGLTCSQMRAEAERLKADAERFGVEQNKRAERDAVLMATSLLVFAPAAIGISGNDETAAQLAETKGKARALSAAATAKECS